MQELVQYFNNFQSHHWACQIFLFTYFHISHSIVDTLKAFKSIRNCVEYALPAVEEERKKNDEKRQGSHHTRCEKRRKDSIHQKKNFFLNETKSSNGFYSQPRDGIPLFWLLMFIIYERWRRERRRRNYFEWCQKFSFLCCNSATGFQYCVLWGKGKSVENFSFASAQRWALFHISYCNSTASRSGSSSFLVPSGFEHRH